MVYGLSECSFVYKRKRAERRQHLLYEILQAHGRPSRLCGAKVIFGDEEQEGRIHNFKLVFATFFAAKRIIESIPLEDFENRKTPSLRGSGKSGGGAPLGGISFVAPPTGLLFGEMSCFVL